MDDFVTDFTLKDILRNEAAENNNKLTDSAGAYLHQTVANFLLQGIICRKLILLFKKRKQPWYRALISTSV